MEINMANTITTTTSDKLKQAYEQARADRKAIEAEMQSIEDQIAAAIREADAEKMISLRARKASLSSDFIRASTAERKAGEEYFEARFKLAEAAQQVADAEWRAADMALFNLRERHAQELRAAEAELSEKTVRLDKAKVDVTEAGQQLADNQAGYHRSLKDLAAAA
jgi:hypothetical protein